MTEEKKGLQHTFGEIFHQVLINQIKIDLIVKEIAELKAEKTGKPFEKIAGEMTEFMKDNLKTRAGQINESLGYEAIKLPKDE